MAILQQTLESLFLAPADKQKAEDAQAYLAERLAAVTALVDKSAPTVNMLADSLPRGEKGRRGPSRTLLYDVARGLARRVPLTKLVELDGDIRPYLAALMVASLYRAGEILVVPRSLDIKTVANKEFESLLAEKAGQNYNNYGRVS